MRDLIGLILKIFAIFLLALIATCIDKLILGDISLATTITATIYTIYGILVGCIMRIEN